MNEEQFNAFLTQLSGLKDNKAIALYLENRFSLLDAQRILVLETFLIQCIQKIAGLEHRTGGKIG